MAKLSANHRKELHRYERVKVDPVFGTRRSLITIMSDGTALRKVEKKWKILKRFRKDLPAIEAFRQELVSKGFTEVRRG